MRRRYLLLAAICVALAVSTAPVHATITWTPGPEPTRGRIDVPEDGAAYACGADVQCRGFGGVDEDRWTTDGPCPQTGLDYDDEGIGFPVWVVTGGGSWKYGDNTGPGPIWIAPNSPTTGICFYLYDGDLPKSLAWCEDGNRDDEPEGPASSYLQDTNGGVRTIVPVVDSVLYHFVSGQGQIFSIYDVTTPEYDRASGRNEPASWQIGSRAQTVLKFWHAYALSQPVDVNVYGITSGDDGNIDDWGECGPITWARSWPASGGAYCTANETINASVEYHTYETLWIYRCPEGSNSWIESTWVEDCNLFGVYDTPRCPATDYIKKNITWACDRAHDGSTVIGIADKIHAALAGDPPMEPNECDPCELCWDWDLLEGCPYYGECDEQADFMISVLDLLGVGSASANYVFASEDAGAGHRLALDDRWVDAEHQWLIMDFAIGSGESPNAWEGVAVVLDETLEDYWYAVWPSYKATDDYDMLKKLSCEQWWVKTFGDRYPGHPDGWAVQYWCEQIPKP
jgi:hypothetical protein